VNAIYFKALFTFPFSEKETQDAEFHQEDGTKHKCRLMFQKHNFSFAENEHFQAIDLPYSKQKNSDLMATVFLPTKGQTAESVLEHVAKNWDGIASSFKTEEIRLHFPKFKVEYSVTLNDALKKLGVQKAFSSHAQFDQMTKDPQGLQISEVLHKAFVEVDEKGTEAAAATAVVMTRCLVVKKPKEMRVDHPFLFLIRSDKTVLFAGLIHSV